MNSIMEIVKEGISFYDKPVEKITYETNGIVTTRSWSHGYWYDSMVLTGELKLSRSPEQLWEKLKHIDGIVNEKNPIEILK